MGISSYALFVYVEEASAASRKGWGDGLVCYGIRPYETLLEIVAPGRSGSE